MVAVQVQLQGRIYRTCVLSKGLPRTLAKDIASPHPISPVLPRGFSFGQPYSQPPSVNHLNLTGRL